jgi:hypothetical protein
MHDPRAASRTRVRDNTGNERSANAPAQQFSSVSAAGRRSTPIRPRTEEARFKSAHLPPTTQQVRVSPASSRRRSLHAAAAPRPHAQVAVQPRRLAATRRLGPGPHTMTTQRSRRRAAHPGSPPTGDPRAHSANPGRHAVDPATAQPPPTTTAKSKPTPPLTQQTYASLDRQLPTRAADELAVDRAGDHADAGHPSHAAVCPTAPSTTSRSDTVDAGTHGHRTPTLDTGHQTSGRSDARTGHRTAAAWTGTRAAGHPHQTLDSGRWPRTPTR